MQSFVICRMYAGSYLTNKMGSEIINLLHDDKGDNYVYVNPYGRIASKYDDTVKGVLLVRLQQKGVFEILGIAKIGIKGQLVSTKGGTAKERREDSLKQLTEYENKNNIIYDGVRISEIYNGNLGGTITFKSDKLLQPNEEIYIADCDHSHIKLDGEVISLIDKRFPTQSLISYIDNVKNPEAFKKIENLINNSQYWNENINKILDNKIVDKNFNYLNIIKKEDDELVFSNLFFYFFSKFPELLIKFAKKVLNVKLSMPVRIEREKANIDIWIEDDNNILIIENKIKSGIHGVSARHSLAEDGLIQSQLLKYYKYVETHKDNKKAHYFISLPVYNRVDISIYSGSKHYEKVSYKDIYEFFLSKSVEDEYYNDFVKSLYKHTKYRKYDYYEDMAHRFIQRIKQVKAKTSKRK